MTGSVLAGRYRLQQTISSSAMAEVLAAEDLVLDRQVVVKLLAPQADRPRFEREARAAAALAHPNIVQLFDFGRGADRPYMVFEYLPGGSLEERLADSRGLPFGDVARIAEDVAAGLAHAHEHGVVHRDLKPANVLFDAEGRAKIADFGIARVGGADTLTEAGTVLGTAGYISPEQAGGEAAGPASDVYSFGVLLYRMLSGRLPFEAESAVELAAMHRASEVPPVSELRAGIPPPLAALVTSALAKDPGARPADGEAVLAALRSDQPSLPSGQTKTLIMAPVQARGRTAPRRALVAAIVLVAAAVAGLLAAVLVTQRHTSAPAAPLTNPSSPGTGSGRSSAGSSSVSSRSTASRQTQTRPTTHSTTTRRTSTGVAGGPGATSPATSLPPSTDTTSTDVSTGVSTDVSTAGGSPTGTNP